MSGGKTPRPKGSPFATLSPQAKLRPREPGSPLYAGYSVVNKCRAGMEVLPENALAAIAGLLDYAAHANASHITVRVEVADKEHMGEYGLWRVRLLEDDGRDPKPAPGILVEREVVRSWYGPVEVELVVVKHGLNDYEIATRVKLTSGPNKLWRALFFASRALFLAALEKARASGDPAGVI